MSRAEDYKHLLTMRGVSSYIGYYEEDILNALSGTRYNNLISAVKSTTSEYPDCIFQLGIDITLKLIEHKSFLNKFTKHLDLIPKHFESNLATRIINRQPLGLLKQIDKADITATQLTHLFTIWDKTEVNYLTKINPNDFTEDRLTNFLQFIANGEMDTPYLRNYMSKFCYYHGESAHQLFMAGIDPNIIDGSHGNYFKSYIKLCQAFKLDLKETYIKVFKQENSDILIYLRLLHCISGTDLQDIYDKAKATNNLIFIRYQARVILIYLLSLYYFKTETTLDYIKEPFSEMFDKFFQLYPVDVIKLLMLIMATPDLVANYLSLGLTAEELAKTLKFSIRAISPKKRYPVTHQNKDFAMVRFIINNHL